VTGRSWEIGIGSESLRPRDLAGGDIARLIPDGAVMKTWVDGKAVAIPALVAVDARRDGH